MPGAFRLSGAASERLATLPCPRAPWQRVSERRRGSSSMAGSQTVRIHSASKQGPDKLRRSGTRLLDTVGMPIEKYDMLAHKIVLRASSPRSMIVYTNATTRTRFKVMRALLMFNGPDTR
eukprot:1467067-Prymnesium_polylepis.1